MTCCNECLETTKDVIAKKLVAINLIGAQIEGSRLQSNPALPHNCRHAQIRRAGDGDSLSPGKKTKVYTKINSKTKTGRGTKTNTKTNTKT